MGKCNFGTVTAAFLVMLVGGTAFSQIKDQTTVMKDGLQITKGYIEVPGGSLYFDEAGKGDPIVLVHDGNLHHVTWDAQFPVFAEHYRVIRYDRRGYGESPATEARFSNVADLKAVFDALRVDKAIVIGMSAGGRLTIDFTLEYPEKVTTMVLVGAVVSGFPFSDHFYSRGGRVTRDIFYDPVRLGKYMFTEDPYTIYEKNTEARKLGYEYIKKYPKNYDTSKDRLVIPPSRPALPNLGEINVPALIVVGEFDIPDVHAHSGAIEAGIKGSKRVIIRNSAHLVPMEQPEIFNYTVLNFLGSCEFFSLLKSKGVKAAIALYKQSGNERPIVLTENQLNSLGYQHLNEGNVKDAIELFKLNVEEYPNSANVYDSLGEAYLKDGNTELAILNYKKSLELNPDNTNAKNVLKQIKNRK